MGEDIIKLIFGKITCWSFLINKDYGFELALFNKIRKFKDGLSFFSLVVNWDRYIADHSPRLEFNLLFLNWMIIEINIYNIHHRDSFEESKEYSVVSNKGKSYKVKDIDHVSCILLRESFGDYSIRIRNDKNKHGFIDYDIAHSDLSIIITDNDASLYEDSKGNKWVDHSPQALGYRSSK